MRLGDAFAGGGARLLEFVRSGLYRPRCRICGQDLVARREEVICSDCLEKIKPAAEPRCPVCGQFLAASPDVPAAGGREPACGSCLLAPPPYVRHVSYAAYEGILRQAIILYKYGEVEPLRRLLARLCLETVRKEFSGGFDAVVPVPADRRRRHGFQPVRAVGRILARGLGVDFWPRVLLKKKHTPPQVGLSQAQRKVNLDGAFALAPGKRIDGKSILLIDDVATTGTTIDRCAALLRKNGARVTALTLARSRH